jgi:hypothetical protein
MTTLSNAGVGDSIVSNGLGPDLATKGIIGGTNITVVDSGTDLTLNGPATGAAVFQEVGGIISPISGFTNGLYSGETSSNVCTGPANCTLGGRNISVSGAQSRFSTVIGGDVNTMIEARDSVIAGCTNTLMGDTSGGLNTANFVGASDGCTVAFAGGGTTRRMQQACILGALTCSIKGVEQGAIVASEDCDIDITGTRSGKNQVILGGFENKIIQNASLYSTRVAMLSGEFNTIEGHVERAMIIGGNNCTINTPSFVLRDTMILNGINAEIRNVAESSTIIGGQCSIDNFVGCTLMSDRGGPTLDAVANNRFMTRFRGGYTMYSNGPATVGVSLAAGGNSWASVSDVNKKENLTVIDGGEVLGKLGGLIIYEYNFIGNPPEQKCRGPTAQGWHAQFPDNKDPLSIETNDMIGVLLASVKELSILVNSLSLRVTELEGGVAEELPRSLFSVGGGGDGGNRSKGSFVTPRKRKRV